ncbi:MAG: amidohydrolase [Devosia sp.]|nr:amidohydrolase [Devosia sp.]
MFDLFIRNVDAILPGSGRTRCSIGVRNGKIAAILAPDEVTGSVETIDASGLVAFPGLIDPHLHLGHGNNIAAPEEPRDADLETAAAAKGGITTFIPYLLSTQPYSKVARDLIEITAAGARIDFGYHFIISTEDQLAEVPSYAAEFGVPTFKVFMNNRGGEGSRLGLPDIDDGFLFRLCEAAAANNGMVNPHPENIEIAWILRDRLMKRDPDGESGLAGWNDSRPDFIEAEAVHRVGYIGEQTGAPIYAVHISSAKALEAGLASRRDGRRLFMETCPHYLTHDISFAGGNIAKINPPVRTSADRERLWQAVLNGEIDTIGTDHVHRTMEGKSGGIWKASPGCPGMETMLPVLLSEGYHKRGLSLERIAEITSTNTARIMGLSHCKGALTIGLDADITLVDLDAEWTARHEDTISSAGYTIYHGWTFKGAVTHTYVRGHAVVLDGQLVEDRAGHGAYLERRLGHQ